MTPANAYLMAYEMRWYLEVKNKTGGEKRAFPLAGDLFLDALETSLAKMGPNFFKDHYTGIMGCYRQGDDPTRRLEIPLYVADLLIRKVLLNVLPGTDTQTAPEEAPALFMQNTAGKALDQNAQYFDMARSCIGDAVQGIMKAGKTISKKLIDYLIEYKERVERALDLWQENQTKLAAADSPHERLVWALDLGIQADHVGLVAAVKEEYGALYEEDPDALAAEGLFKDAVHPFYEAADAYLKLGNVEREQEAYNLCGRRYEKAAELFRRIHDRTSTAKVLVEKARVYIKREESIEEVKPLLHEAMCLVVAHIKRLPREEKASIGHDEAIEFLEQKGYHAEAEAYRRSREKKED